MSRDSDKNIKGTGLNRMIVEYPTRQRGHKRFDHCFFYVTRDINPKKLKGVGQGYTVYYAIWEHNLLGLHQDKDAINNPEMRKTRKVFTKEMEAAVAGTGPEVDTTRQSHNSAKPIQRAYVCRLENSAGFDSD